MHNLSMNVALIAKGKYPEGLSTSVYYINTFKYYFEINTII